MAERRVGMIYLQKNVVKAWKQEACETVVRGTGETAASGVTLALLIYAPKYTLTNRKHKQDYCPSLGLIRGHVYAIKNSEFMMASFEGPGINNRIVGIQRSGILYNDH